MKLARLIAIWICETSAAPSQSNHCREERSSRSPETLSDPKWGKHKFINVNGDYKYDNGDDDDDDAGNNNDD